MTDHTDSVLDDMEDMDDLELITRLLNGQLSPERAKAVKRRLKEDAAFLELAAPLLLAWTVPPRIERQPRPEGEWERDWAEFKKRTGFPLRAHEPPAAPPAPSRSRRSSWRRWLAVLAIATVGGATFMVLARRPAAVVPDVPTTVAPPVAPPVASKVAPNDPTNGAAAVPVAAKPRAEPEPVTDLVPYQSGWITLESGIEVQLTPGAELRVAQRRLRFMRHLILKGTARFRVPNIDSARTSFPTQSLIVETPAGFVTANESEFTVFAGADTTEVRIHAIPGHPPVPPLPMTLAPVLDIEDVDQILFLSEPGTARLVRGRNPVRLPPSR